MLSIPPEILAEIFEYTLPESFQPTPASSPLLLCQICRFWRATAISTPVLWSFVGILIDIRRKMDNIEQEVAIWLELLELWFSRSSNHPLHLDVNLDSHSSPHPSLAFLLDSILRHCERWEVASLRIPLDFLSLIRGDMPLLRELTFGPADLPDPETDPPIHMFFHAPLLRKAVLTDRFGPDCICLPWLQLTHLEGLCLFEAECLAILRFATNLVHCEVQLIDGHEPEDSPIITMPALLRLALFAREPDASMRIVLDCLALPALQILEVPEVSIDPIFGQPLAVLKNLLSRSGCSLRELHIKGGLIHEAAYREALYPLDTMIFYT